MIARPGLSSRVATSLEAPAGLPRLLAGVAAGDGPALAEHLGRWGGLRLPGRRADEVIGALERAGLRGRGGAAFPTSVKWTAVARARRRRPVVVVNGAEAEPASAKDRLLLGRTPHLVLDGAGLAAATVGAARVVAYVPADLVGPVSAAVEERRRMGLGAGDVEVVPAAGSFVAGEESAVVDHLNGGPGGRPSFTAVTPVYRRGVGGRPTLVQNAETLAHAALIGRFGAEWFRTLGTDRSPGTALLTVTGPAVGAKVVEVELGTRLGSVLTSAGIDTEAHAGVLTGGYGGTWLALPAALGAWTDEDSLRAVDATLGAGVLALLPLDACPLSEVAHLSTYLAGQSAGQCGPCVLGLPALASAAAELAWGSRRQRAVVDRLEAIGAQVVGRGACHHPDGVARMVRSALRAFGPHVEDHLRFGPCRAAAAPPALSPARAMQRVPGSA